MRLVPIAIWYVANNVYLCIVITNNTCIVFIRSKTIWRVLRTLSTTTDSKLGSNEFKSYKDVSANTFSMKSLEFIDFTNII